MILRRLLLEAELREDARNVTLDGGDGDKQLVGDSRVRAAFRHQDEDVAFARGELIEWPLWPSSADHALDDIGIQRRPTRCDAPDSICKEVEISHALLQ